MALLRRGDPRERDDTLNLLQYGSRLPFEVMQAAGGFPRRGLLHTNGNAGSGYSRKKTQNQGFPEMVVTGGLRPFSRAGARQH